MKNTHIQIGSLVASLAILTAAAPAFAQSLAPAPVSTTLAAHASASLSAGGLSANASTSAKLEARISLGKARADQEIDRRIAILTQLNTQVQGMVKLSVSEKATVANQITTEISALGSLKTKIDADSDLVTLRADIKSIVDSYRVFLLVIPQGRIEVAADKISATVDAIAALSTKLQSRISAARSAGQDVTGISAKLADLNAKVADANAQISAAASGTASLTPDNGDAAKASANTAAIHTARAQVQTALKDMNTARADARAIVQALESMHVSASASSSASVSQ